MGNTKDMRRLFHKVIVVDTSVLIKGFLKEKGSEKVDELIKMAYKKELTLLAPTLLVFEFLNVMGMATSDTEKVIEAYKKLKKIGVSFIDPDENHIFEAVKFLCENRGISYYDSSYHALAKDFDAIFLTADKKYYEVAKSKGRVELFA
jgi:predicted nucleic acid-binding protein